MKTKRQKGQALLLMVLLLGVLLFFAALAVDVGVLYTARTSAQHIADAAALAGAYTFLNGTLTQPTAAQDAALAAAKDTSGNWLKIMGNTITMPTPVVDQNAQTVTTTAAVTVPVFFARVFLRGPVDVQTTATAEAGQEAGGTTCLRPFWVLNSNRSYDPATGTCSNPLIRPDGTLNPVIEAALSTPAGYPLPLYADCAYNTDITYECDHPMTPSQWGLIDPMSYGGGGGAAGIVDILQTCVDKAVLCSSTLDTKNGAAVGPVLRAVDELIGDPNQDTFLAPMKYQSSSGNILDTSKSVITMAIYDDCNPAAPNPVIPGKQSFKTIGFGSVFVKRTVRTGKPRDRYIDAVLVSLGSCGSGGSGSGGGTGSGGTGTTGGYPIRLINKTN